MAFAPPNWRKFFSERGWELVGFEELAQTAMKLKRQPPLTKAHRFIGRAFPGWYQKQVRLWESGVALLRRA